MRKLLRDCKQILGIKKPVRIIDEENADFDDACALYSYENKRHVIVMNLEVIDCDNRSYNTILAHELIHAWQQENKPTSADHGNIFKNKAKELETKLNSKGWKVRDIYVKGVDV